MRYQMYIFSEYELQGMFHIGQKLIVFLKSLRWTPLLEKWAESQRSNRKANKENCATFLYSNTSFYRPSKTRQGEAGIPRLKKRLQKLDEKVKLLIESTSVNTSIKARLSNG